MKRSYRPRSLAICSAVGCVLTGSGCDLDASALGSPTSEIEPATDGDGSIGIDNDAEASSQVGGDAGAAETNVDSAVAQTTYPPPGSCDLQGSFAVQLEAQVEWQGSALFDFVPIITPGKGKITVVVLTQNAWDGQKLTSAIRACGATTPDFASSINETYSVAFPDALWDKLALRWTTNLTTSCLSKNCDIQTDPVVAELGIGLPTASKWPTSRDPIDVANLRDDDNDGVPGIMLACRGPRDPGGLRYAHPPTTVLLTERASEISIGIRLAAQLQGKLDDCDKYSGDLPAMSIDTRAFACVNDYGTRCSADSIAFIDDNFPEWKVNGAKFKAVRLPPAATCADARTAMMK